MNTKNITKRITTFMLMFVMLFMMATPAQTHAASVKTVKVAVTKKGKTIKKTVALKSKTKLQVMNGKKKVTVSKVKFKSSNKKVATISKKGVLTAKKAGRATITVKYGKKKAKVVVTVKKKVTKTVAVKSVSLNFPSLTLYKGNNATLEATVLPANATNKNVTWSTSDASVASINKRGVTCALKPGKATITATTVQGKKVAKCKITVLGNDTSSGNREDSGSGANKNTGSNTQSSSDSNTVTVAGVEFDVSNCPDEVEVYGNSGTSVSQLDGKKGRISVVPQKAVSDADVKFVIDKNTINFSESSGLVGYPDGYSLVGDWESFIADIVYGRIERADEPIQYGANIDAGIACGDFNISIYYKNKLIKKTHVIIKKAEALYVGFRKEVNFIEQEGWKGLSTHASDSERLGGVQHFVSTHYTYGEVNCINGASILGWVARDLGYEAKYRSWVDDRIYDSLNAPTLVTHVSTLIYMNGEWGDWASEGHDV